MSDWFVTGKNTIWYKNTFTAISNDYLSAFSTYFNSTVTDYIAYVYLNDKLVDSISGSTLSGYYTIKLNKLIPLFKGDKFTIAIRINTTGLASFPIEEISAYRLTLHPNVSYFSYDGNDWYETRFFNSLSQRIIRWTTTTHWRCPRFCYRSEHYFNG